MTSSLEYLVRSFVRAILGAVVSLMGILTADAGAAQLYVSPDGSADCKPDADLMWLGGYRAVSHDVYFGTERNKVAAAGRNSPEFRVNQTSNIFGPGALMPNCTYYWRIDAVTSNGEVVKGPVWRFTVSSGLDGPRDRQIA